MLKPEDLLLTLIKPAYFLKPILPGGGLSGRATKKGIFCGFPIPLEMNEAVL